MYDLIAIGILSLIIIIALKKVNFDRLDKKLESIVKAMDTGLYGFGDVVIRKKRKTSCKDEQYVGVDDEEGNLVPDESTEKIDKYE